MEQKILDLLAKAGCKPELVAAIGESLVSYKTAIQERFEADYTAKIQQAKKVCVEETEEHKRDLARRLQVFLETHSAAIDAHLARQSALSESEAVGKLRNVKSLLEGTETNVTVNNGPTTATIEKAKHKIQQLSEERDRATAVANRQNAIAEKVLKNNRTLVAENARLKSLLGNKGAKRQPMTEGRGAPRGQRIDASRRGGNPTTTRSTLVENQTRVPAAPTKTQVPAKGFGVADIAANMDEDLI